MAIEVYIPSMLRKFTDRESVVQIDEAGNIKNLIEKMNHKIPGFQNEILEGEETLKGYLNMFVNEQDIRSLDGMATPLKDGDEVFIVASIAGG